MNRDFQKSVSIESVSTKEPTTKSKAFGTPLFSVTCFAVNHTVLIRFLLKETQFHIGRIELVEHFAILPADDESSLLLQSVHLKQGL